MSTKHSITTDLAQSKIKMSEMEIGQWAIWDNKLYGGVLNIIRIFSENKSCYRFADCNGNTWNMDPILASKTEVTILPPGTKITITIGL